MMYRDEKKVEVNFVVKYEYDSELEKIKDIIKQVTDLEKIEKINVEVEK